MTKVPPLCPTLLSQPGFHWPTVQSWSAVKNVLILGGDRCDGQSWRSRSRGFSGQLGSLLPGGINSEITLNQEPGYIFADCSRAQDGAWRGPDHSVDLGTGNGRRFPFPFDPRSRQLLRALR
jgi:hypothetical protein